MTRLPSESFWPTGAIETSDPSIISPLVLPKGASGYFDQVCAKPNLAQVSSASQVPTRSSRGGRGFSPLSPGTRGPAQPSQFLSPHLAPAGRETQRSTSLPPSHRETGRGPSRPRTNTGSTSRAVATPSLMQGPAVNGILANSTVSAVTARPAAPPRTVSGDSMSSSSQSQMIRRLIQQNGRIREAWEAERKYMEANRERAEEVYKEERAFMEEERMEWEDEKMALLQEIERLQQQVASLGGNFQRPKNGSALGSKDACNIPQSLSLRGGGGAWDASPESMRSSLSSQGVSTSRTTGSVSQANADGSGLSTRSLLGLDPMAFRPAPPTDLTAVPEVEGEPIPVVDVQEIDPELEGIWIKATSIQKSTFTDGPSQGSSKNSSRATSPPGSTRKEQTLQVLAAAESARLTMHAGHTPSHSLSVLPTVSSSGAHTARSSGESTPTMLQTDGSVQASAVVVEETSISVTTQEANANLVAAYRPEPEPIFEPVEDRELKGPLMVRNMPAHDEIFFRRLSDKLEEVIKDDQAALPAVLKEADPYVDGTAPAKPEEPSAKSGVDQAPQMVASRDDSSSAASDSGTEKERSSPRSSDGEELDIPLKFKRSTNFGAPLGTFRF